MKRGTFRSAFVNSKIVDKTKIADWFTSLDGWVEQLSCWTFYANSSSVEMVRGAEAFSIRVGPDRAVGTKRSTYFGNFVVDSTGGTWPTKAIPHSEDSRGAVAASIVILFVKFCVTL